MTTTLIYHCIFVMKKTFNATAVSPPTKFEQPFTIMSSSLLLSEKTKWIKAIFCLVRIHQLRKIRFFLYRVQIRVSAYCRIVIEAIFKCLPKICDCLSNQDQRARSEIDIFSPDQSQANKLTSSRFPSLAWAQAMLQCAACNSKSSSVMTLWLSVPPNDPPTGLGPDKDLVRRTSGRLPGSFIPFWNAGNNKKQKPQETIRMRNRHAENGTYLNECTSTYQPKLLQSCLLALVEVREPPLLERWSDWGHRWQTFALWQMLKILPVEKLEAPSFSKELHMNYMLELKAVRVLSTRETSFFNIQRIDWIRELQGVG